MFWLWNAPSAQKRAKLHVLKEQTLLLLSLRRTCSAHNWSATFSTASPTANLCVTSLLPVQQKFSWTEFTDSLKLAFKIVIAQWFSHHLGIDHLFYYCFMSTGLPILQYICHSLFLHALEWTPGTSLSAFLYSKAVMHTSGGSYKM
jgi:hypothetical protein